MFCTTADSSSLFLLTFAREYLHGTIEWKGPRNLPLLG